MVWLVVFDASDGSGFLVVSNTLTKQIPSLTITRPP